LRYITHVKRISSCYILLDHQQQFLKCNLLPVFSTVPLTNSRTWEKVPSLPSIKFLLWW